MAISAAQAQFDAKVRANEAERAMVARTAELEAAIQDQLMALGLPRTFAQTGVRELVRLAILLEILEG